MAGLTRSFLTAFSRASVPSSSAPIKRLYRATSAASIAASRRSTCSVLKVPLMLGEFGRLYSRIVGRCPVMPKRVNRLGYVVKELSQGSC